MPTILTHGLVGLAGAGSSFPGERVFVSFWVISAIVPALPDLDAIAFRFGVPYGAEFGHRGITHSILFAAAAAVLAALIMIRTRDGRRLSLPRWCAYFFLLSLTHPLLDACTNGGLGVALFAPFSDARYFFPFRPIKAAPIAVSRFFSPSIAPVIVSELLWVWIPAAAVMLVFRKTKRNPERN